MRAILKELPATLKLALPISLGMLGHMIIQLTDSIMLGNYATVDLASSAFGSSLVLLILYLGIGFGQAISALGSKSLGAGNPKEAYGIYKLSSWSAFVFSAVAVVVAILILPLYDHLGQPELVAANAKPYSLLIALSFVPTLFFQTLRNYYEALKKAWIPFLFLIGTVVVNILCNYMLIFGKWGAPEMGIIGSGLGTLIARTLTMVAFLVFARLKGEALNQPFRIEGPIALAWQHLKGILKIAAGAGLGMTTMSLAYILGALWIGTLGTAPLAANRMVGMIDGTLYMVCLGLAYSLTNRIGRAWGEGNPNKIQAIYRGGLIATVLLGIAMTGSLVGFADSIIGTFTNDPEATQIAHMLIIVAAGFLFFDSLNGVVMGALKGLADVAKPAMIYFAIYWLGAMPLGYYLTFVKEMGAVGVWLGYSVGIISTSMALLVRFNLKLDEVNATLEPRSH